MGMIKDVKELDALASSVADTGDVYFVTAFSGLYAPYWRDDARATIVGMTLYTTKAHICRAALEATCFQTYEVLEAMRNDSGVDLTQLNIDGGMTHSEPMCQIQSNILQKPVARPSMVETTALGAAIAAGLAVGFWDSIEDVRARVEKGQVMTIYKPQVDSANASRRVARWKMAVEKSMGWATAADSKL